MDFHSEEDVNSWISKQKQEIAIALAARSALRMLPLVAMSTQSDAPRLILLCFRSAILALSAAIRIDHQLMDGASPVARRTLPFSARKFVASDKDDRSLANSGIRNISSPINAFDAATAVLLVFNGHSIEHVANAIARIGPDRGLSVAVFSEEVDFLLARNLDTMALLAEPLWLGNEPRQGYSDLYEGGHDGKALNAEINILREALLKVPAFDFWLNFYDKILAGGDHPWPLWRKIALIDPKIWDAGPEAVAEEIARIEAGFARSAPDETIYRQHIRHLITHAAQTELGAEAVADGLEQALAAWAAECGNHKPDELVTLEAVPPILRRIASAVSGTGADREALLRAEIEMLRRRMFSLENDVRAREEMIRRLSQDNSDLSGKLLSLAAKPTLREKAIEAAVVGFASAASVSAWGLLVFGASQFLGPLLESAILDFFAGNAHKAPTAPLPEQFADI